ncbi:MAG TPA: PmoA family protein [Candidatus Hydrogenedentes bacterium]|nr:PmoA family protein [Candidatus Hydrogenedentota bacterium]HOH50083.1 PmoA family protein [Candidatus Hydrogenedentota bacterium]
MSFMAMAIASLAATGAFSLAEEAGKVTVLDGGVPVMVYCADPVKAPKGVPEKFTRGGYIHPLYGLDGEVLTEDFPWDHYHHRGLFWAWPDSTVGGRKMDVWSLDGARQVFVKWLTKEADEKSARLTSECVWVFDDAPDAPVVRETAEMVVLPVEGDTRAMDLTLRFENVGKETITVRGATTGNKGYGGLCLRPDSKRKPMHFTAAAGKIEKDVLELASPWADVSIAVEKGSEKLSGLAVFQHPSLPGYPHPGWIMRNYGFLGQSWPHTTPYDLEPGKFFTLKYRVVIHRGSAEDAGIEKLHEAYVRSEAGNAK